MAVGRQRKNNMSIKPEPLFCSDSCANAMLVRSFGECPECKKIWDGQSRDHDRHYRNNAWQICDTCSREQRRCAKCGINVAAGARCCGDIGRKAEPRS